MAVKESILKATEKLANDNIMMDSYKAFYQGKGYFLTKNSVLDGAKAKPGYFAVNEKVFEKWWDKLDFRQRKYLAILSNEDENRIGRKKFSSIKKGYDKWNSDYMIVFYGGGIGWACNLFVGEALYLANINKGISGKYLSAKQIWDGVSLKKVDKKEVSIGDIAAFNGTHVEIVTKVNRGQLLFDDDFCSRGAGRGSSDFGTERCEGMFGDTREIDNKNIRFLRAY